MILGALIDAGFQRRDLDKILKGIKIKNYNLDVRRVLMGGLRGTHLKVVVKNHAGHHVQFKEIVNLIKDAKIARSVKEKALMVFENLAKAEAKIHGCKKEDVKFHEVGAVDAVVDIVGAVSGFDYFNIEKFVSSPLPFSRGFVESSHGRLPLPAPAVLELLKGVPLTWVNFEGELVTPTGAAILKTFCSEFGNISGMTVTGIGYGAGDYARTPMPDVLRILIGESLQLQDKKIWVIETNIDDMNPQWLEPLMDGLLKKGVQDVFMTQVIMKKGRPGFLLTVLVEEDRKRDIQEFIFKNTTTIGLRCYPVEREVLVRGFETRNIMGVKIRFKKSILNDKIVNIMPEFEDLKALAKRRGISLKEAFQLICSNGK